jgi:hypothetical protein
MKKLFVVLFGGVSPVRTSIGVWLFAASVIAVIAFVSPHPWWRLTAATSPVRRPYASAIIPAPCSWRLATKLAPDPTMACVTKKFPLPTTPKTWRTPRSTSSRPTASLTRMSVPLVRSIRALAGAAARGGGGPTLNGPPPCVSRR